MLGLTLILTLTLTPHSHPVEGSNRARAQPTHLPAQEPGPRRVHGGAVHGLPGGEADLEPPRPRQGHPELRLAHVHVPLHLPGMLRFSLRTSIRFGPNQPQMSLPDSRGRPLSLRDMCIV